MTQIKDQKIGLIEVKRHDGTYLSTTVMKFKDKLITGSEIAGSFFHNEWEVHLKNYYTLEEALDDLYAQVSDSASAAIGKRALL